MTASTTQIKEAAFRLQNEEVVGIPTETVYGLAASIHSEKAIKNIFKVKERPFFDPLIVHISSQDQLQEIAYNFDHPEVQKLIETFWPGPLSIILPKHESINPLITSGLNTVAVRMPNNQIALEIIKTCGAPLAAPSANKFSKTSPTRFEHVKSSFSDIFVVDGGPSVVGIESTVVQPCFDGRIKILRPGIITESDISNCFDGNIKIERISSMAAPGNVEHHYMPDIPLILCRNETLEEALKEFSSVDVNAFELKLDPDGRIAARELYEKLRQVPMDAKLIYFVLPDKTDEIWDSIMDRLNRAASYKRI